MKKILFTGGDGKLCSEFKKLKNSNFIFLNKSELDITDNFLENKLNLFEFDYILHSAALTRPMILHDEFPTKSIETNIIGTSKLVNYCIKNNMFGKNKYEMCNISRWVRFPHLRGDTR